MFFILAIDCGVIFYILASLYLSAMASYLFQWQQQHRPLFLKSGNQSVKQDEDVPHLSNAYGRYCFYFHFDWFWSKVSLYEHFESNAACYYKHWEFVKVTWSTNAGFLNLYRFNIYRLSVSTNTKVSFIRNFTSEALRHSVLMLVCLCSYYVVQL